jgi:transposase, IS5 family
MPGQPGLFDRDERDAARSAAGDPLERLAAVVDFELFGDELDAALDRADRTRGGRPPYAAVLMVKVLVLQTLYTRSDDQTEYQIRDRLWFMRFLDRALEDRVPDAKTIWLFREQLTRAGTVERRFQRFDAVLRDAGYLAMGGQIVDATVIQARRPRLSQDEKATVKGGGIPKTWPKAKRAQMATDGAGPSSAAASDWLNAAGRRALAERARHPGLRLQEPPRHRPPPRLHPHLCRHRRRRSRRPPARPAARSAQHREPGLG